ncbi:unknown [Firmicutes bacterium CAG:475]|nr:unknown [Firmicutes bacterium CAG:475]
MVELIGSPSLMSTAMSLNKMPPMPYARIGARLMFAAMSIVKFMASLAIVMLISASVYL